MGNVGPTMHPFFSPFVSVKCYVKVLIVIPCNHCMLCVCVSLFSLVSISGTFTGLCKNDLQVVYC